MTVLIRPLVPVIMAHILSAMTNLAADIRISAFRFLDVLIHAYPLLIAADYVTQITQSFVEFLGKLGLAGQIHGQLPEMLDSLLIFLSAYHKRSRLSKLAASSLTKEGQKDQKLSDNFRSLEKRSISCLALHWYKSIVPESTASMRMDAYKSNKGQDFPLYLGKALVKALSNCWAECAPLVCSGQSPDKHSMQCMIKVCAALHLLIVIIEPRLEQQVCLDTDTEASGNQMQHSGAGGKEVTPQKWIEEHLAPLLHCHLIGSFPISAPPINLPQKVVIGQFV
ncbi:hypothetical protein L7F22_028152 [Adiantum nelumboides]|nr:hypothetical protein [Adiantum nelumboides]